jgi:hypothetical protein
MDQLKTTSNNIQNGLTENVGKKNVKQENVGSDYIEDLNSKQENVEKKI